jgi:hypothetical protein
MPDKPRSANNLLAAIAKATEVGSPNTEPTKPALEKGPPDEAPKTKEKQPAVARRGDRSGTRLIAGHFDPAIARQLRMLAAEEDTTIQSLLGEALNLLFVKKGKGKIVSSSRQ